MDLLGIICVEDHLKFRILKYQTKWRVQACFFPILLWLSNKFIMMLLT